MTFASLDSSSSAAMCLHYTGHWWLRSSVYSIQGNTTVNVASITVVITIRVYSLCMCTQMEYVYVHSYIRTNCSMYLENRLNIRGLCLTCTHLLPALAFGPQLACGLSGNRFNFNSLEGGLASGLMSKHAFILYNTIHSRSLRVQCWRE